MHSSIHYNGNSIIEYALSENHNVKSHIYIHLFKYW